uniref:Uncharacterized protein n=1 Tax=Rhizophora mucronata TaxID=61149 RepID=A0A2P2MIQ8_RHIMU
MHHDDDDDAGGSKQAKANVSKKISARTYRSQFASLLLVFFLLDKTSDSMPLSLSLCLGREAKYIYVGMQFPV